MTFRETAGAAARATALTTAFAVAMVVPCAMTAQGGRPPGRGAQSVSGTLSQNTPNPVKSETSIPFTVGDHPACADRDREFVVSITVLNILAQPTTAPVLQRGGANRDGGPPVMKLRLRCGSYTALWKGSGSGSQKDPPPGAYRYTLEIDGRTVATRTMTVSKD